MPRDTNRQRKTENGQRKKTFHSSNKCGLYYSGTDTSGRFTEDRHVPAFSCQSTTVSFWLFPLSPSLSLSQCILIYCTRKNPNFLYYINYCRKLFVKFFIWPRNLQISKNSRLSTIRRNANVGLGNEWEKLKSFTNFIDSQNSPKGSMPQCNSPPCDSPQMQLASRQLATAKKINFSINFLCIFYKFTFLWTFLCVK